MTQSRNGREIRIRSDEQLLPRVVVFPDVETAIRTGLLETISHEFTTGVMICQVNE
jgi:hypothetical protein